MSSLNLSSDGPAIQRSYKSIVDGALPKGSASSSSTYGQWALYSVSAPLANAFQNDSGKESVLRLQSTGEGELVDLIDDFSDGRIQFGFVKVKDPNTQLPKSVLIAWCGEGVPERTKGYFTSHLAAVSKLLHGYHVQITARTDNDLNPDAIIRKVADASGSKYGGDTTSAAGDDAAPPPPLASKPVFQPTQSSSSSTFKTLGGRSRVGAAQDTQTDEEGWGNDAPRVTRTQLEKVASAYQPTKVNMAELTSQKVEPSRFQSQENGRSTAGDDVVRGAYQPVGKVDIAAIRRQAQASGQDRDDRPAPVKGSYEPVGKVDIAAIRARAQPSGEVSSPAPAMSSSQTGVSAGDEEDAPPTLSERSAAFTSSERMTSMPKPKVANRFGSQTSSFTGTKAPTPIGYGGSSVAARAPVGAASKNFADEGGKTPAQIWAERKARERGTSGASETTPPAGPTSPMHSQTSGGHQSGYGGKKWGAVSTTRDAPAVTPADEEDAQEEQPSSGGVSAIRDRFKNAAPMGRSTAAASSGFDDEEGQDEDTDAPPPLPVASRPGAGVPIGRVAIPGFARPTPTAPMEDDEVPAEETAHMPPPPPQMRSSVPDDDEVDEDEDVERSGSPIRIAMPTSRASAIRIEAPEERFSPPPMPIRSIAQTIEQEPDDEPEHDDLARNAGVAAAQASMGAKAVASITTAAGSGGKRAVVQFDYEKAEENELELKEGDIVTNIEMVDTDWWMGENVHGEKGLFPSNYVELVDGEEEAAAPAAPHAPPAPAATHAASSTGKPTATAQFEYEAAEDNELSFPEGATISALEFPDEDWWMGTYKGKSGLFPANYVQLDE